MIETLGREELIRLLQLFGEKLSSSGISGTVSIVGGAALTISYIEDREATRDIDALFPRDEIVRKIIEEIALAEDLPMSWINDEVLSFIPFENFDFWDDLFQVGSIKFRIGKAELLLAMKLKVHRGRRDSEDLIELLKLTEAKDLNEIQSIFEKYHPQEVIPDENLELVIAWLAQLKSSDS